MKFKKDFELDNARLQRYNEAWVSGDETRRKEFAKAFDWTVPRPYSGGEMEAKTPTWPEIFVKLGTLIAARNFYDFEGNISELECAVEALQKKIEPHIP